jgi:hypothetical protein
MVAVRVLGLAAAGAASSSSPEQLVKMNTELKANKRLLKSNFLMRLLFNNC